MMNPMQEYEESKLVSIGLLVYNGERFLQRALDSLIGQTYKNFELIISDNASTDNTRAICEEYARKDTRIRYVRQKENLGQLGNFLYTLGAARGEYFLWASYDDWWDERFMKTLYDILEGHREYAVAMSSFERVFGEERRVVESLTGAHNVTHAGYLKTFRKMMLSSPAHMAVYGLWRRDFLERLVRGYLPRSIRWDRILMVEAALAARIYTVPDVLFFKYQNPTPIEARYSDFMSRAFTEPFTYTRFMFLLLFRPLSSRVIPLVRKWFIPIPWLVLVWRQKRQIFWDFLGDYARPRKKSA